MIRKVALVVALVLVGMASSLVLDQASGQGDKGTPRTAPYVHCVIFHLKKDAPNGEADALIADAHELLSKIPSVRGIQAGKPAEKSSPNFIQKDYQVGLLILVDNYEGLETYLNHPLHQQYVEKHLKHVDTTNTKVYDFVNPKK